MTLAEQNAALEAMLDAARGRFFCPVYTIKDHYRDPNAPYFASAVMIGSGNAAAPVSIPSEIPVATASQPA